MDLTINAICSETAKKFSKLAGLRGISNTVEWKGEENSYYCNGVKCGVSILGCYEWLEKQPGVKP